MAHETAIDPVCGMTLETSRVPFRSDYEGMRYYFCSEECKQRFDRDPESYLASDTAASIGLE